jgi:hypothetical protein
LKRIIAIVLVSCAVVAAREQLYVVWSDTISENGRDTLETKLQNRIQVHLPNETRLDSEDIEPLVRNRSNTNQVASVLPIDLEGSTMRAAFNMTDTEMNAWIEDHMGVDKLKVKTYLGDDEDVTNNIPRVLWEDGLELIPGEQWAP